MITALLATTTSLFFGFSDFLGGLASRRESPLRITANAQAIGLVLLTVVAVVFRGALLRTDLAWGAVAGLSGGIGVAALYAGLSVGRMSVVAPVAAALSGPIPAAVDLMRGAELRPVTLVGIALALVAVVVVGTSAEEEESKRKASAQSILLAVAAGVGFSGSFLGFSMTSDASGLWPLVAARVTSVMLVGMLALVLSRGLVIDPATRSATAGAALTDAVANITMLSAIRSGPLAIASVLGSLYPAVVVVLAFAVLNERLKPMQQAGIALAMIAVVLTALP